MKKLATLMAMGMALAYGALRCPEDDSMMWPTGQVRVSGYGKLLQEYQCAMGHRTWVAQ